MISDLIASFATSLLTIFLQLFSILPDSPFGDYLDQIDISTNMSYINYFIPFDFCLVVFNAWLSVVAIYYAYPYIIKALKLAKLL